MSETLEQRDREQWEAYVRGELARIADAGFDVFDSAKLRKAHRTVRDDLDAWRGPWRNVRAVATQEFIWHVENYGGSRITWQDWQSRRRAERDREREAAADPEQALRSLELMRDLMSRRGEMFAELRAAGIPWATICEASGMSRMQAHTILAAWRDAQPLDDDGELI